MGNGWMNGLDMQYCGKQYCISFDVLWLTKVDWTRSAVGLSPELSWRGSVLAPRPSGLGSCPSHETQRLRQHRAHAHLHS